MGRAQDFDMWWCFGGLGQRALVEGGTLHKVFRTGSLREGFTPQEVVDLIAQQGCRVVFHIVPSTKKGVEEWIFVAPDRAVDFIYIHKDRATTINTYSLDAEFATAQRDLGLKYIERKATRGRVYVVVSTNSGTMLSEMGVAGEDFIPSNYRAETVEEYRHVVGDLNSPDPCGRIVILDGPPGTGKTHMVRALLNEVPKATFILVPSNMLSQLGSPSFVRALIDHQMAGYPMILIIEDADECLASRKADTLSEISALLNFSDGIFGAVLDMRIVATTNVHMTDLDEAVMRDGRLCRRIEVGKLTPEEAENVYRRLVSAEGPVPPFTRGNFYTLGEVYKLAKGGGGKAPPPKPPKGRLGFAPPEASPTPAEELGLKPGDLATTDTGELVRVRPNGQFELADDDLIDEDPEETPEDSYGSPPSDEDDD